MRSVATRELAVAQLPTRCVLPLGVHQRDLPPCEITPLSDASPSGRLRQMILRDMTEADLDVLFDIQDDDIAQYMAGFTSPDAGDRDSYIARFRRILADDRITKRR